jgi:hypothetical protein
MAFTPISLPTQDILLTNYITDIGTITNANISLLQGTLEDLINNLQIDTTANSIGTTIPISSIKANSMFIQNTGLYFQTGSPTPTVIGSLTKNVSNESILNVHHVTSTIDMTTPTLTTNALTVNTTSILKGSYVDMQTRAVFRTGIAELPQAVTVTLSKSGTIATGTLTLTRNTPKNILVTLKADTSVYTGGAFVGGLSKIQLKIDFTTSAASLPTGQTFTIYLVNFTDSTNAVQLADFQNEGIPFEIIGGTNQTTSSTIETHDGTTNIGYSDTSMFIDAYHGNVTFAYIKDYNNADRIVARSLVGMELY